MSGKLRLRWPCGITFPEVTDDHIGRMCTRGDVYEASLLQDIRTRSARLALDVGAHIGVHTIWLSALCGYKVVAIEPTPATAAKLRANVAANGLTDRVVVMEAAAGAASGRGRMEERSEVNTGMNRLVLDPAGPVEVITIDSLEVRPALIKIDVEGEEMAVLEGAAATIERHKPLLYVEGDMKTLDLWAAAHGYRRFGRYAVTPVYGYRAR